MKSKLILYILLFVVLCVLTLGNLQNICHAYTDLGSDSQALLFWKYTSSMGLLPFRDVFYPYGYLDYYLGQNIFITIIYLLFAPTILLATFLVFRKLFKNLIFSIFSFVTFYLFVVSHVGFEVFTRYGSLLGIIILFVYVFDKYKVKPPVLVVGLGLLSALIFPLINDTGIYSSFIYLILMFVQSIYLLPNKNRPNFVFKKIFECGFFLIGYGLGFIPFLIYLYKTNSIGNFIFYLNTLQQIALFAKTPYFHSIFTTDNLFTLSILIVSIIFISLSKLMYKKTLTFNLLLQIGLVVLILLLEQKSIVRSIDSQITFVSLFLFFVLFAEFKSYVKKIVESDLAIFIYLVNFSFFIIFLLGLHSTNQFVNQYPSFSQVSYIYSGHNKNYCVDENVKILSARFRYVSDIKNKLESLPDFNGKIFSFPSDPILYIALKQNPPFYPTLYEATPPSAQNKVISYIKEQSINYVVYNSNSKSIQDGVPDVIRGKLLVDYIDSNFKTIDRVDNFLILKKIK